MVWTEILVLLLASGGAAAETRIAQPGVAPPAARASDFAWMEGTWVGQGFGAEVSETYSRPVGGQMPGHFSIVRDGKPGLYEFVMIAETGPSIEYRVRHFNADMTAWEDKASFVRFPLVAVDKDVWYFDGLTIRRIGPDSTEHVVRVKGKDGSEREEKLHYRRVPR